MLAADTVAPWRSATALTMDSPSPAPPLARLRVALELARRHLAENLLRSDALKNPAETRNQIIDGWLHMGDLASRDKNGYMKIYGRTKDLINRGGYKIYPHELECMLVDHPKVEQVCIVATPNPVLGESICACVIPRPGETVSLEEIREIMKDQIESLKKITALDFDSLFCAHNPQLQNGKAKLQSKLQFLEDFHGRIKGFQTKGLDVNAIINEMGLKENYFMKAFCMGNLCMKNMVRSACESQN